MSRPDPTAGGLLGGLSWGRWGGEELRFSVCT